MTFIVLLVVGLVALAGVIAFAGDRLGTYVGRRRLSLFGARPRRTGQIVGVMAGILIMLSTLVVLAVAFQNATDTLLNFQRTLEELARLQVQERVLNDRVTDANTQLADLRTDLDEAQETIRTAEAQRDAAMAARDAAGAERDALIEQRDQLQGRVDEALAEVRQAEIDLDTVAQQLSDTQTELSTATSDLTLARSDRDAALAEADQAQAEAARLQDEVTSASDALVEARSQLSSLTDQLVAAGLDLANAEAQVRSAQADLAEAQTDLAAAEGAKAAAEGARDEALVVRDAAVTERDAAQEASRLLTERLNALNAEVLELDTVTQELRDQADSLMAQNTALALANETLATDNQRLQEQSDSLGRLNTTLETEIRNRNDDLVNLQGEVNALREDLETQSRLLDDLQQEAGRFEGGEVFFVKDQLIYSGAIYSQAPAEVRQELASFIADATAFVARRGVERIRVTADQFNLLVDVITQTPESDLVRLISPSNQISSTIDVLVEALENTVLFERGQLIISSRIHLGTNQLPISQDEIRNEVITLKAEALRKMRRAGLDEGQLPDFGPVTEEMFTNMLLRLTGPVTIGLVATEPVSRAGLAKLELMILY